MWYPFILKGSRSLKKDHPYRLGLDVLELESFFQTDVKSSNEFEKMAGEVAIYQFFKFLEDVSGNRNFYYLLHLFEILIFFDIV